MKLKNIFIIIIFSLVFYTGCQKKEYRPTVQISRIETNEGKSTVSLSIDENYGDDIHHTGISYDTIQVEDITKNQLLYSEKVNSISIDNLVPNKEYYFVAFASNRYGYSLSENFKYTVPNEIVEIPCTKETNMLFRNNISSAISANYSKAEYLHDEFVVDMYYPNKTWIILTFSKEPYSGTYTIVDNISNWPTSGKYVEAIFYHNNEIIQGGWITDYVDGSASDGKKIYVENNAEEISFTFCDLTYSTHVYDNNTYELRGNYTKAKE
jgi:hypothetical protein